MSNEKKVYWLKAEDGSVIPISEFQLNRILSFAKETAEEHEHNFPDESNGVSEDIKRIKTFIAG